MHLDDMELTSFLSEEPQRRRPAMARYVRADTARRRPQTRSGSMLAKIGFCVAVLAIAMLVQKYVLPQESGYTAVEASAKETDGGQGESEDVLGRLRFVDAGGAKSVFAVSQRWSMPVGSTKADLQQDDTLLRIVSRAGESVSVAAAGEVRAISQDGALGRCIRIHHGSDLESVYYNIDDIRVEVGQPLLARDTLGKVGGSGMLYVAITQSGVPQVPTAYLEAALD